MRPVFLAAVAASVVLAIASSSWSLQPSLSKVATEELEQTTAGTFYYCATSTPGGESGCADCIMDESGDWVRCPSENIQLTACDPTFYGPPPSPFCEDRTQECGGKVWVYDTESDCLSDTGRQEPEVDCARTFVQVYQTGQTQVNCPE